PRARVRRCRAAGALQRGVRSTAGGSGRALSELSEALTFLFDDGLEAAEDRELEQVKKAFNDRSSHDALASSLEGVPPDGACSRAARRWSRDRGCRPKPGCRCSCSE